MRVFDASSIDALYHMLLQTVYEDGQLAHPRGFDCKELGPCTVVLSNPQANILINPARKASKAFMAAELVWMLMGRKDVEMISFYNQRIAEFSDFGVEFFGSYGPKIVSQLPYILRIMQKDPWTRQAVINIWRENPGNSKDIPCTVAMHFIQRPAGTLNLIVYMRSQDLWLGFPYDVHNFTCIQLILASMLGCVPGTFTLVQGSLHLYSNNLDDAINAAQVIVPSEITPLSKLTSLKDFQYQMIVLQDQDIRLRTNKFIGPFLNKCKLLEQKMLWMFNYARKKHEARNH